MDFNIGFKRFYKENNSEDMLQIFKLCTKFTTFKLDWKNNI